MAGWLDYARGVPPRLVPVGPVVSVMGGVVLIKCPHCGGLIEWRIVSAA